MVNSSKKIFIVACLYDKSRLDTTTLLFNVFNKIFSYKYEVINLIVINNKQLIKNINVNYKYITLEGDNSNGEFGAWQYGLDHIKNNYILDERSIFIFFNDTVFHNFYPSFNGFFRFINDIDNHEQDSYISGDLQTLPVLGEVMKLKIDKYICTALFALNFNALRDISFNIINFDQKRLELNQIKSSYDLLTNYFDEALSYRIGYWLFGGGWYKGARFNEFDKNLLRLKLAMIINEKLLSANLLKNNCSFKSSLKSRFKLTLFLNNIYKFTLEHKIKSLFIVIKLLSKHNKYNKRNLSQKKIW